MSSKVYIYLARGVDMTNEEGSASLIDRIVIRDLEERDMPFVVEKGFLELARHKVKVMSVGRKQEVLGWQTEVARAMARKKQAIAASLLASGFEERTIGYCMWDLTPSLVKDYEFKMANLSFLYVDESYRGKGVGKALVKEAARRVIGRVPGIEVNLLLWNRGLLVHAAGFYESIGFKEIGRFEYGCYDLDRILGK